MAIVVSSGTLNAIELISSADTMEAKSWSITGYGKHEESEPVVENGNSDLEFEAAHDAAGLALTVRPGDGLHYRLMFGVLQNYTLKVGSGAFVNRHDASSSGYQYGMGVRWSAIPQTSVSIGAAFDLSYMHQTVDFDRLTSNGAVTALDERFEQDEIQAAANISKRWKQFEPYGGLKVSYVTTKIVDHATLSSMRGTNEEVSPFVGFKWEFFQKESLIVEASFADEESILVGLNIQF